MVEEGVGVDVLEGEAILGVVVLVGVTGGMMVAARGSLGVMVRVIALTLRMDDLAKISQVDFLSGFVYLFIED